MKAGVDNLLAQVLNSLRENRYQEPLLNPSAAFDRIAGVATTQAVIFGCGHLGDLALFWPPCRRLAARCLYRQRSLFARKYVERSPGPGARRRGWPIQR
jgi:hypothetical protein